MYLYNFPDQVVRFHIIYDSLGRDTEVKSFRIMKIDLQQ